jgi:hypothetical protein
MKHSDMARRDVSICIDRSVSPVYPCWIEKVMHPEFENIGPNEYDLGQIELRLHVGQNAGVVAGYRIYEHLRRTDSLKSCLGLLDAAEIHRKGITLFKEIFGDKSVYFWRSVVQDRSGGLHVRCLHARSEFLVARWDWLDLGWNDNRPAAQFAK